MWGVSGVDQESNERIPTDALLDDYRRGRLEPRQRERIEWALTRSGRARRRLFDIAELPVPRRVERVRRRLFEGEPLGTGDRPRGWGDRSSAWWNLPSVRLAVGVALAAIAVAIFLRPTAPAPAITEAGELPEYVVRARGLAARRDAGRLPSDHEVRVTADGRLRIFVEPVDVGVPDVRFGLFRETASGLERIAPGIAGDFDIVRGAASIELAVDGVIALEPRAEGDVSEPRPRLWITVGAQDAPVTLDCADADRCRDRLEETAARVFPLSITLDDSATTDLPLLDEGS